MKTRAVPNMDVSDFIFYPLDKRFVPPKPRHTIEEKKVLQLEKQGNLVISRKRDGYFHFGVTTCDDHKIYTRTCNDVSHLYPKQIADLRNLALPPNTILAFELCADENGRDVFPKVAKLAKTEKNRAEVLAAARLEASLMPFNIFVYGGKWLHEQPNEQRFELLSRLFENSSGSHFKPFEILSMNYETAKQTMRKLKWEGLVLYDRLAPTGFCMTGEPRFPYRPYGAWKKKDKHEDDFVAIEKIKSDAPSWPGALKEFVLVQYHPETGEAIPCGKIGNGLTKAERWELIDDEKFPLPLVVQVRFTKRFMDNGKGTFQSGDFVTVRYDKSPEECLFDSKHYEYTRSQSTEKIKQEKPC